MSLHARVPTTNVLVSVHVHVTFINNTDKRGAGHHCKLPLNKEILIANGDRE